MKIFIFYLFLAFLALSLQASPLFHGARPDLILILVACYSLKYGQLRGTAFGVVAGFLFDSASGSVMGPHMLSKAIAGYLIPSIRQQLIQWNIIIHILIIVFFSVAEIVLHYVCFETFSGISLSGRPLMISMKQVLLTALSGIILYFPFNPEKEDTLYSYGLSRHSYNG
jgi:rod shape-determining protein MreD